MPVPQKSIWDEIFENDTWLRAVLALKNNALEAFKDDALNALRNGPFHNDAVKSHHPLNPCLVGYDLLRPSKKARYLALIISDWSGDARYKKDSLINSLKTHEYNEAKSEIYLRDSNITLHIGDAVTGQEWVKMKKPYKLFRECEVKTAVTYYQEDRIYPIAQMIGVIENLDGRERVKHICSIPLRFGDGNLVFRVFRQIDRLPVLVQRVDGEWITGWRLAEDE